MTVDGSHMSAAECRASAESCMVEYHAARNMDGKEVTSTAERRSYNELAQRRLARAAEWRAAALEAEQREAWSRGDR